MTIERTIEANTAAVEENTAVQKKILAILEEGQGKKAAKSEDKESSRGSRSRDDDDTGGRKERTSSRDRDDKDEDRGSRSSRSSRDEKDDDRGSRSRSRDDDKDEDRGSRSSRSRDDDKDEDRGSRSSRSRDDDKPAKEKTTAKGKAKKPKLADVRAAFTTFMEVNPKDYDSDADAKDEEESRRKFVEAVLDELGADKTSDIKEEDFERVLGWIADKADGKKVRFDD